MKRMSVGFLSLLLAACSSAPKVEAPVEKTAAENAAAPRDLVISRVFDAPVKSVWKAWTDCKQIKRWWGPKEYTAPNCKVDLKVGGKYLLSMRGPDRKDYWSTGTYTMIDKERVLEFDDSFSDEKGNIVKATHYGLPAEFPEKMPTTVKFEKQDGGKTQVIITQVGHPGGQMFEMATQGWNQSLDKLATTVKK